MRKIFTSKQAKDLDKMTMEAQGVSSYELMERAVYELFRAIEDTLGNVSPLKFIVVAGTGNNGGDGLGIARLLMGRNANVKVWLCDFSDRITDECSQNLSKLKSIDGECVVYLKNADIKSLIIPNDAIVVDAIFGTGLSRCAEGNYAELIKLVNKSGVRVFSIDIPSGLFGEDNNGNDGEIIRADTTFKIQDYSLSAMFAENYKYYGDVKIVDINHDRESIKKLTSNYYCVEKQDVARLLKKRSPFDHKGTYGHALLLAGAKGKAGAAVLAARACMRSGVGLLTVHLPQDICDVMQVSVPEAMIDLDDDNKIQSRCLISEKYTSIGIGPGIGTDKKTYSLLEMVMQSHLPSIFDADALNIISENKSWYNNLSDCVLTPHPKEFERLFGKFESSVARIKYMSDFSVSHKTVVVLKGGVTIISLTDGKVLFYIGLNPGIATGGSGDVLTGVITSLLAQGYSIDEAAIIGVWVHGEAGKIATGRYGSISTIASDIVDAIPLVYRELCKL